MFWWSLLLQLSFINAGWDPHQLLLEILWKNLRRLPFLDQYIMGVRSFFYGSFYFAGQEGGSWSSALLLASPAVTALITSISSSSSSFTAFNMNVEEPSSLCNCWKVYHKIGSLIWSHPIWTSSVFWANTLMATNRFNFSKLFLHNFLISFFVLCHYKLIYNMKNISTDRKINNSRSQGAQN